MQNKTLTVETYFDTYQNCKVKINNYHADGTMCVDIWNSEDGAIARLTTCLNKKGMPDNQSYIDTNNCPWAISLIKKYNLGHTTGSIGFSGYCMYPVVEWNLKELEQYK